MDLEFVMAVRGHDKCDSLGRIVITRYHSAAEEQCQQKFQRSILS